MPRTKRDAADARLIRASMARMCCAETWLTDGRARVYGAARSAAEHVLERLRTLDHREAGAPSRRSIEGHRGWSRVPSPDARGAGGAFEREVDLTELRAPTPPVVASVDVT